MHSHENYTREVLFLFTNNFKIPKLMCVAIGFRVFATARDTSKITDLADLGIETLKLTVDNPQSIAALKEEIVKLTGGKLDMLINNAGQSYSQPALDMDFNTVQEIFDVNVFAVMRMVQAFAPLLIATKGAIVQIGSITAAM
jgi:1-acylglycerone phosphate reductase